MNMTKIVTSIHWIKIKETIMSVAHILGFPRIGAKRELKFAQEQYWQGKIDQTTLLTIATEVEEAGWRAQAELDFFNVR